MLIPGRQDALEAKILSLALDWPRRIVLGLGFNIGLVSSSPAAFYQQDVQRITRRCILPTSQRGLTATGRCLHSLRQLRSIRPTPSSLW